MRWRQANAGSTESLFQSHGKTKIDTALKFQIKNINAKITTLEKMQYFLLVFLVQLRNLFYLIKMHFFIFCKKGGRGSRVTIFSEFLNRSPSCWAASTPTWTTSGGR
jgi:hypothetical protein